MECHRPPNKLRTLDITLNNIRDAGFQLDAASIAFLWRAAKGEVSAEEISNWSQNIFKTLGVAYAGEQPANTIDSLMSQLGVNTRHLVQCFEILHQSAVLASEIEEP